MALDEPTDTDHIYEINGFTYIVNKEFMEKAESIKVDFAELGFTLDCGIDFGAESDCSGCGTNTTCS
jgi:Fe-S cluster assembly iron-binding protein IscA